MKCIRQGPRPVYPPTGCLSAMKNPFSSRCFQAGYSFQEGGYTGRVPPDGYISLSLLDVSILQYELNLGLLVALHLDLKFLLTSLDCFEMTFLT